MVSPNPRSPPNSMPHRGRVWPLDSRHGSRKQPTQQPTQRRTLVAQKYFSCVNIRLVINNLRKSVCFTRRRSGVRVPARPPFRISSLQLSTKAICGASAFLAADLRPAHIRPFHKSFILLTLRERLQLMGKPRNRRTYQNRINTELFRSIHAMAVHANVLCGYWTGAALD